MKILVVGAGGVGGYFGAKLINAGAGITYLEKEQRYELLQRQGLTIETPTETFTVHPKLTTANQLKSNYDLIMLAPKAFDLDGVLHSLNNITSKGVLLPFLNGFSHIKKLDDQFGKERVMGGIALIMSMITPTGSVKRFNELHSLTIGHRSQKHEALAKEFYEICIRADFDHFYSENIEQALWDKWVFLASLAGLTTLLHSSVGKIVETSYGKELTHLIYEECCLIAKVCGFDIDEKTKNKAIKELTKENSPLTSSMLRDLNLGQKTEHEHILHDLIQRGTKGGVNCELLKLAYTHINLLQTQS